MAMETDTKRECHQKTKTSKNEKKLKPNNFVYFFLNEKSATQCDRSLLTEN